MGAKPAQCKTARPPGFHPLRAGPPGTHAGVATGSGVVNLVTVSIAGYVYNSIVTYVAPATLNFNTISVTMRANL